MLNLRELLLLSMLTVVLFVSEQALSFLPNIQVTVLLIVIYTKLLGLKKTLMIVLIHTLSDNLMMGSLVPMTFIPMLIGWSLIPILLSTIFKPLKSSISLAFFGFFFSYLYGFIFIPFTVFFTNAKFSHVLLLDIPFSTVLGTSSFISILWLYEPLYNFLNDRIDEQKQLISITNETKL